MGPAIRSKLAATCWFTLVSASLGQTGGGYDLTWSTIDGGGGTSSGGGYELNGTVGQPDASAAPALSGGTYDLTGGFWGTTLPACSSFVAPDFDQDCDVDLDDYGQILACTLGADVPYDPQNLPVGCGFSAQGGIITPDFDGDGDVDPDDFGVLQRCLSGADVPAQAGCDQ